MAAALLFAVPTYAQDTCTPEGCPITIEVEGDTPPAFDPETYERYRLPEGRRCEVDGETFQCFNLEEYRELLFMDNDLRYYDEAWPRAQSQIEHLGNVADQLRLALTASEAALAVLSQERDRLLDRWTEENRLRLAAENRPVLGSPLAWALAAGEAIVIVILLGVITGGG